MKRVVDGLLYDTDSSELIYTDEDKHRKLFKTENGNFFMLFITGEIQPKSEESTKDYLGKYDVNKYIEIFGEPEKA